MPIYVDHMKLPFKGRLMSHMTADTLAELHDMADMIGMKRIWFQCPHVTRYPHHDIDEVRRDLALGHGAIAVSNKAMLHYAAKLGVEWVEAHNYQTGRDELTRHYHGIMRRTEKFVIL